MTSSLFLRLCALLALGFTLAPSHDTEVLEPERPTPATVFATFASVRPAVVTGCTAYLENWGQDMYWGGCPTNACGNPYGTNPCQAHYNALRMWCECYNGALVHCKGEVAFNIDDSVSAWVCIKVACGQACTKAIPPAPLEPGVPVYFYTCDC